MSDAIVVERVEGADVVCLRLSGVLDERFESNVVFRDIRPIVILDLAGIRRITSFGVRQWSDAMKALSSRVQHLYIARAPACFVDQLNMVLNFGGRAEVVTATALYFCEKCQDERAIAIDVLGEHALLVSGAAPAAPCPTCGTPMALEEDPQQAFRFVSSYGARAIVPEASALFASTGLYTPRRIGPPPEEWKLIHGEVTLLVLSGTLDQRFRPRRLSSGVEGEVVLDVGRVVAADATGIERFRQLLSALEDATHITLVDVPEPLLREIASGGMPLGRAYLASALLAFSCASCGNEQRTIVTRQDGASFRPQCASCGDLMLLSGAGPWLERAFRGEAVELSPAVEQVVAQRAELISRARAESGVREGPTGTLGRYRVLRPLSRGGMAEILLAVHEGIGGFEKLIALKKIRRKLLERKHVAVELFLNEAKIVANLNHPNIVQTFEVGEHGGDLFIAMEYVHGVDARTVVKKRATVRGKEGRDDPLGLPFVLYVGTLVAAALDHAHKARDLSGRQLHIVHRDVSLSNIVIGFDGQVKLVDFGIATADSIEAPGVTGDGLVGKFSYMSPEQVRRMPLDGRSDVFSLGIALYELVSGRPLFRRASDDETLLAIQDDAVPSLAEHGVPAGVEAVLRKALERDRDVRYADARAFELALQQELQALGGVSAHQLSLRMRELFPDESAAAPTASSDGSGVPEQEADPNDSGSSQVYRSQTFSPEDLPRPRAKILAHDALVTPAFGVRVMPPDPPAEVVRQSPSDGTPVVVPSARPGSGVHFNRTVRMPEHVSQAQKPVEEAAPVSRSGNTMGKTVAIIGLLIVVAGLLLFLLLR